MIEDKRSETELYLEYLLQKVDEVAGLIDVGQIQAGRDGLHDLQVELVRLCKGAEGRYDG